MAFMELIEQIRSSMKPDSWKFAIKDIRVNPILWEGLLCFGFGLRFFFLKTLSK